MAKKIGPKSRKNLCRTWLVGFEAHLVNSKSVYFSRKIRHFFVNAKFLSLKTFIACRFCQKLDKKVTKMCWVRCGPIS